MQVKDRVYGSFAVNEPVLKKLLVSPSVLRLKKISQYGVPDEYYNRRGFSRFEHSVGVMLLLRKLGATLEEQVAGLLHDVSHFAFSHVYDWVFSKGRIGVEDDQDNQHVEFVLKTEIPGILKKHGFSLKRILAEENFSLLERKIPDLSADRLDYSLREFKIWFDPSLVPLCLKNLMNYNGEIVFKKKKAAKVFALGFLELQAQHWGSFQAVARYYFFSEALKIGLKEKEIKKKDFLKDEVFVLKKLKAVHNREIKALLKLLKQKELAGSYQPLGKKVFKKFRHVDPKIMVDGQLVHLSKISPYFKKTLAKHRLLNQKGLVV